MCFETKVIVLVDHKSCVPGPEGMSSVSEAMRFETRSQLVQTKNRGIAQSMFVAKASQSSPLDTQSKDISRFVLVAEASRSLARTFRGLYSNRARIMLGKKTRITDPTAITVFLPC